MDFLPFLTGSGKLRYWYIAFYIFGLPIYLFSIYLLFRLQHASNTALRVFALDIFTLGYLMLALCSLITTIMYVYYTKKFFLGFFTFFGIQLIFWMIGNIIGNNYEELTFLFIIFLCIVIYSNLKTLEYIHSHNKKHHIKN